MALAAFKYQYGNNEPFRTFCEHLNVGPGSINRIQDIPFLPIEFFKHHPVVSGPGPIEKIFSSSGTTDAAKSKHYLLHEEIYKATLTEGFRRTFGDPSRYSFLALLPGYIEREDSSLIYMVNELMKKSQMKHNAFFMEVNEQLVNAIHYNQQNEVRTVLFGVSFSLVEFAKNPISLERVHLIETGGMKGKMEEITRKELHEIFRKAFKIDEVYSEYGMTELLSQAYSLKNEEFESPPWMQVLFREINDPMSYVPEGRIGGINIIDLANIHSCCFISTQDLGKKTSPNTFEVLGRLDNADIRGCNLLFS